MTKTLAKIFDAGAQVKPFFVFDLANNHMGDTKHGMRIIREFAQVTKKYPQFLFGFKFQFRHIPSFIHPDYKTRMDIKYVKRFSETYLTPKQFQILKNEVKKHNFISVCTPFDEPSVDLIEKLNFDIVKIASCSFTDWPLLERIVKSNKPIIASTGGVKLEDVDKVVSFLQHRNKKFILMHCVGAYPTPIKDLQLNQIDLYQQRYPDVPIGYSTHEEPDNFGAVQMAVAKGARVFEKHVAVKTKKYDINAYSVTPEQAKQWLKSAKNAYKMAGVKNKRCRFGQQELADLRKFKRGIFAKRKIKKGELVTLENTFSAWPNQDKQLLANDMSKYNDYIAQKNIPIKAPILTSLVKKSRKREKVYKIVKQVRNFLSKAKIALPNQLDFEISHHYGIDKFKKYGLTMITCINRDYCKKLLITLPGQNNPHHYHKKKEETFHVLYGDFTFDFDGKKVKAKAGDIVTVPRGVKHDISSKNGGVLEEISTTHYISDSYYLDKKITQNKNRKTRLTYWKKL